MLELFFLIVAIALAVWLLNFLPLEAPFKQIILVVGVFFVVVACFQFLFNYDVLSHVRGAIRK